MLMCLLKSFLSRGNEDGYGDVFTLLGVALIVLGLLLILLLNHMVIGIVLAIVGVVLLVAPQARGRL